MIITQYVKGTNFTRGFIRLHTIDDEMQWQKTAYKISKPEIQDKSQAILYDDRTYSTMQQDNE